MTTLDAVDAVGRFWEALAAADDLLLARLLAPKALDWLSDQPGTISEALIERLRVTPDDCRAMHGHPAVEVLEGGRYRVISTLSPVSRTEESFMGWRAEVGPARGGWTVDPIKRHDEEAVGVEWVPSGSPFGSGDLKA